MAFFNDLSKKITEVAGDAADKAKDVAGIAKFKTEIMSEQKKLQQGYAELGKVYFEMAQEKEEGPEAELCADIKVALANIAELEAKIESIKGD